MIVVITVIAFAALAFLGAVIVSLDDNPRQKGFGWLWEGLGSAVFVAAISSGGYLLVHTAGVNWVYLFLGVVWTGLGLCVLSSLRSWLRERRA